MCCTIYQIVCYTTCNYYYVTTRLYDLSTVASWPVNIFCQLALAHPQIWPPSTRGAESGRLVGEKTSRQPGHRLRRGSRHGGPMVSAMGEKCSTRSDAFDLGGFGGVFHHGYTDDNRGESCGHRPTKKPRHNFTANAMWILIELFDGDYKLEAGAG